MAQVRFRDCMALSNRCCRCVLIQPSKLAGFVDGSIYAKSLSANDGSLQLHADTYKGPIECNEPDPTPGPTDMATDMPTTPPTEKPTPGPTDKPTAPPTDKPTPGPTDKPTAPPTPPKTGGDPHFQTWTGKKFDYHGECDLVLVHHPNFANGLGLRVHIRTTRVNYFSYIETVAVQIGQDTLEFNNDLKNFWINGEKVINSSVGTRFSLGGHYVDVYSTAISVRLDPSKRDDKRNEPHLDLIHRRSGFPYIRMDTKDSYIFEGALGMMGDYKTGRLVGRDGFTEMPNVDDFALEWQVLDSEPMLFSSARAPQFPEACVPPKKMLGKRLGDTHMRAAAEKVCAAWKEDKDDCIFDVMATRMMDTSEEVIGSEEDDIASGAVAAA